MKYRDNMTDEEMAAFMAEWNELDRVIGDAQAWHDGRSNRPPDDWEEEDWDYRMFVDHKGRP